MAYENYTGSIQMGAGMIPKQDFPLVRACDVLMTDGSRLDENELGGSGLPDYTDADNGKFLRLVDGEPTWVLIPNAEETRF
jgi:hypothetical protein